MKASKDKKLNATEFNAQFGSDALLRANTFRALLLHLRDGYSMDCFGPMSEKSIFEATKNHPLDFKLEEIEIALRDAKTGWERIGRQQAIGTCVGNSRSWYYNMSNRYGWSDKQKVETSGSQALNVSIVNYSKPKEIDSTI